MDSEVLRNFFACIGSAQRTAVHTNENANLREYPFPGYSGCRNISGHVSGFFCDIYFDYMQLDPYWSWNSSRLNAILAKDGFDKLQFSNCNSIIFET